MFLLRLAQSKALRSVESSWTGRNGRTRGWRRAIALRLGELPCLETAEVRPAPATTHIYSCCRNLARPGDGFREAGSHFRIFCLTGSEFYDSLQGCSFYGHIVIGKGRLTTSRER